MNEVAVHSHIKIFLWAYAFICLGEYLGVQLLGHRISNLMWSQAVSHSAFNLHFSANWSCWISFHVLAGHSYITLSEGSVQIFCPFVFELPSLNWPFSVLFIFCLQALYLLLCKHLLPYCGSPLEFLNSGFQSSGVSKCKVWFGWFDEVQFISFSFNGLNFSVLSMKSLPTSRLWIFPPIISSRSL